VSLDCSRDHSIRTHFLLLCCLLITKMLQCAHHAAVGGSNSLETVADSYESRQTLCCDAANSHHVSSCYSSRQFLEPSTVTFCVLRVFYCRDLPRNKTYARYTGRNAFNVTTLPNTYPHWLFISRTLRRQQMTVGLLQQQQQVSIPQLVVLPQQQQPPQQPLCETATYLQLRSSRHTHCSCALQADPRWGKGGTTLASARSWYRGLLSVLPQHL
jgi:hypothetical protein